MGSGEGSYALGIGTDKYALCMHGQCLSASKSCTPTFVGLYRKEGGRNKDMQHMQRRKR